MKTYLVNVYGRGGHVGRFKLPEVPQEGHYLRIGDKRYHVRTVEWELDDTNDLVNFNLEVEAVS